LLLFRNLLKMKISKQSLLFVLSAPVAGVSAWQSCVPTIQPARSRTRLFVASREVEQAEENIPYVIARGDGSTGGGGLPMPNAETDDGLTRPKVGAEMPKG
jgi:hypothetical protein